MALLSVRNLSVRYGGVQALSDVSIEVESRGVLAILGANGAGKTSLLKAIIGLAPRTTGSIVFEGRDIARGRPHTLVRAGIAMVPEGRRMLGSMTVHENLEVASYAGPGSGHERAARIDEIYSRFPRLSERRRQLSASLSGGEQQMLAIGRALLCRPRLLLLDEPSLGLAPVMVRAVRDLIAQLSRDLSIVLVEQNAAMAFAVSERVYVLELGRVTAAGSTSELRESSIVRDAYLGAGT
jgi:branched-chain amino acid transport system ATP-binding protein